MTDRGIIFSAPMVRALLDGRKTQTRRLATSPLRRCEVGDRLWVREICRAIELEGGSDCVEYRSTMDQEDDEILIQNTQEASERWCALSIYGGARDFRARDEGGVAGPWAPAIHMPRWASRLTLVVEAVKIEPLQAISRSDAIAEGLRLSSNQIEEFWRWPEPYHAGNWLSPPAAYRWLREQLHGVESWEANPPSWPSRSASRSATSTRWRREDGQPRRRLRMRRLSPLASRERQVPHSPLPVRGLQAVLHGRPDARCRGGLRALRQGRAAAQGSGRHRRRGVVETMKPAAHPHPAASRGLTREADNG